MHRFCNGRYPRKLARAARPIFASGATRIVPVVETQSYTEAWYALNGQCTAIVTFGGSFRSTSCTKRRSMNGSKIWCSRETTMIFFSFSIQSSSPEASARFAELADFLLADVSPNHSRKILALSNTCGSSRLSNDHSSLRSFCNGVPVKSSRRTHRNRSRSLDSRPSRSFSRCASSMMTYCQLTLLNFARSRMMNSYVVTSTLNLSGVTCSAKILARSSRPPT
mmetsp:Transcript_7198/g.29834  ORF Transcript_7198/g.29834 Transcript_7198/m.29834 type:complete len:223 (-) Transcript_7198:2091-2759(-)